MDSDAYAKVPEKGKKEKNDLSLVSKVHSNPVKTVYELVRISENTMQSRVATWERYRRKYRRGLYYLKRTDGDVPLYFTNYIFSEIETVKANMTKNLPLLNVRPKGQKDDTTAEIMTVVMQDSLKKAGIKDKTRAVVHNALICSMGWFKVYYDFYMDGGLGNNRIESILPEDMLVDPLAFDLDDARWVIHRHRDVPVDKIYSIYGVVPKEKDDTDSYVSDDTQRSSFGYSDGKQQTAARSIVPVYDIYECWIRSWEPDRENDWYIVTVAGATVLKSEYSIYTHNKSPFIPWFDVTDDSAENIYYRGVGEVEEIEPLQDRSDSLDMKIYKNISLLSNRQKIINIASGINASQADNTSGRTLLCNGDPSKAIFYDQPPMMSTDIYGYRNQTDLLIQTVSGVFDVTQGRRPTGITAGRAIESLKDSADTRLMHKVDSLAATLRDVGILVMSNILQFYEGDRIIRITDSDGTENVIRVLGDYPPILQPEPILDENGEPTGEHGEVSDELRTQREIFKQENGIDVVISDIDFEYDIEVNSDNALPSARAERAQIAADLFRLGGIDRKALLDTIDFPDRSNILKRLEGAVTGKNAGQPLAEAQTPGMEQMIQMLVQKLGLDPQIIQQLLAEQGGEPTVQNVPPQITM